MSASSISRALREAADAARAAWRRLEEVLAARAGADAPPTSAVGDLLDDDRGRSRGASRAGGDAARPPAPASEADGRRAADKAPTRRARPPNTVTTREEALRAFLDIAEYFRRTEPLSPLAYTLQEAVRRARMTWPQLTGRNRPGSSDPTPPS